jgi:hypothetical protein
MYRVYNDILPNDMPKLNGVEQRQLMPGDIAQWDLVTTVPADNTLSLYVSGYVIYRDKLNTRRGIFFARRYDPAERRFVRATDNPDYESEE